MLSFDIPHLTRLTGALVAAAALALPGPVAGSPLPQDAERSPAAAPARSPLRGTVRDEAGLPVAGAVVVLRRKATGFERIVQTDTTGAFVFSETNTGDYEVVTSLSGFSPVVTPIHLPTDTAIAINLVAAPYQEAVTVASAARDLRTKDTAGLPVTVIGGDALRDAARESVGEALRGVAGVITRRGSEGTAAAGEQIQGIDSRQVLVLVDGQPLAGARGVKSGIVNLDREAVDGLDRIEVVKGAASAIYGSDAIGGVINLITREPRRPLELGGRASGGSHDARDLGANLGGLGPWGTVFLSGGRHERNAFDLTPTTPDTTGAALNRNDVTVRGLTTPTPAWLLAGTVTSRWNTQSGRSLGELGPQQDRLQSDAQTYGATASWQVNARTFAEFRAYRTRYQETNEGTLLSPAPTPLEPGDLFEGLTRFDGSIRRDLGDRHQFRGGVEWTRNAYRGLNRIRDAAGNTATTHVGWAQYTVNPLASLTVMMGTRLDDHSAFGTAVSPNLAATVRVSDTLSAHASFNRGFRAPDLGQLYYQFVNPTNQYQVIGNPRLEPERSRSWQLGVDARRGSRAHLGLNLFHNDVTNLIESYSLGFISSLDQLAAISAAEGIDSGFNVRLNRLLFIYKNLTHVRTQGAELEGDVRFNHGVRVSGAYTYLDAANAATGLTLTGRNAHQGTVRTDWTPSRLGIRANLRGTFYSPWIVSRTAATAGPVETRAARFALWDAAVSKTLARGLELFGAIDNLTDSQDPNTGHLSATGTPLPIYRPEIGRTLRGGVRWNWSS